MFVAVTPDSAPETSNPSPFANAKRVVPDSDGAFTTTLEDVQARFTNEDATVDCTKLACHIASFSSSDNQLTDHREDRSHDDFVPIAFTTGFGS